MSRLGSDTTLGFCLKALSPRFSKEGSVLKLRAQNEKALGKPNKPTQSIEGRKEQRQIWSNHMRQSGCSLQACWDGRGRVIARGTWPRDWRPALTWPLVLQFEVLVRKAAPVDGPPPCAVVVGEVPGLRAQSMAETSPPELAEGCYSSARTQPPAHPGPSQPEALRQRGQKTSNDRRTNTILRKISNNKIKLRYFLPQ